MTTGSGRDDPQGGRPPATSHTELARTALDLFFRDGFDETSIDDIAAAAGIGRRTFFRYFPSKAAVLWHEVDEETANLRRALEAADPRVPMMRAVRDAVVAVDEARVDRHPLRVRAELIHRSPALLGASVVHNAGWAQVISEFVARRTGEPANALIPTTVGRVVLAAATVAYEAWLAHGDEPLTRCLDRALSALESGFAENGAAGPEMPPHR